MIIVIYYQFKISIGFLCKRDFNPKFWRDLNSKSLIQW